MLFTADYIYITVLKHVKQQLVVLVKNGIENWSETLEDSKLLVGFSHLRDVDQLFVRK